VLKFKCKIPASKTDDFRKKDHEKILGPTRSDDGYWIIKTNQEINDIKRTKCDWFIKNQRLNWLGHIERMTDDNSVQKIKRWKPMSKRPIGRPKILWEVDVLEDIKSINVSNWKNLAQNRGRYKKVVEQARTLSFRNLTTYMYIYMSYCSANLRTLNFKYLFNKYTY